MNKPDSSEQYRAECEARYWLKSIGSSKSAFDAVIARIAKRRGVAAAERLGDTIRNEYRKQRDLKT